MKKKDIKLDLATKAAIETLKYWKQKHQEKCIPKKELLPMIVRRLECMMKTDWQDYYDQAVDPPDEKWLCSNWRDIRLHAAKRYRKFIVWDNIHRTGTKLGTFEEFLKIPDYMLKIVIGLADSEEDIAHVIHIEDPNAKVYLITTQTKLLEPGDEETKNVDTDKEETDKEE